MTSTTPSSLYFLPLELIEKTVSFISTDRNFCDSTVKEDLLSLSRSERIGGSWMRSAERELFREIYFCTEDLESLELLAQIEAGDRILGFIKLVRVRGSSYEENIVSSFVSNLDALLSRSTSLEFLWFRLYPVQWNQFQPTVLKLENLTGLHLTFEEAPANSERITILEIPPLPFLKDLALHPVQYNDAEDPEDLKDLFGTTARLNLKGLDLYDVFDHEFISFLYLFPNLVELYMNIEEDMEDIFSSIPPSLRCLSDLNSSTLKEAFDDLREDKNHFTRLN